MIWNGFWDDLGLSDFGALYWEEEKGSYSTKPFVLEAKTAKINNEKYEKINKQVRNKHLWKLIRLRK